MWLSAARNTSFSVDECDVSKMTNLLMGDLIVGA